MLPTGKRLQSNNSNQMQSVSLAAAAAFFLSHPIPFCESYSWRSCLIKSNLHQQTSGPINKWGSEGFYFLGSQQLEGKWTMYLGNCDVTYGDTLCGQEKKETRECSEALLSEPGLRPGRLQTSSCYSFEDSALASWMPPSLFIWYILEDFFSLEPEVTIIVRYH